MVPLTVDPRLGEYAITATDIITNQEQSGEPDPAPVVSIVVPTRNEAGNVEELLRRLNLFSSSTPHEVIFVDDSTDDTPDTIERVQREGQRNVVLIHRPAGQRADGLGGAVVRGLQAAQAPWICVMDGDLQHPPELIPALLRKAKLLSADLVVASRYREDGGAGSFAFTRALVSRGSTFAAKAVFPSRLQNVSDPMSGFFLVRSSAIDVNLLQPQGFKILLEIIGRTKGLRIAEVPFRFGTRFAGESKASLSEGLRLVNTMLSLRFGARAGRFAQFAIVGASGLLVNTLALAVAGEVLGVFFVLAAVLATQISTGWNFLISERFVFTRGEQKFSRVQRGTLFYAMNNAAFLLRLPILYALTEALSINYILSNVISLTVLMTLRFVTADRWIWAATSMQAPTYSPALAQASNPVSEGK